MTNDEKIKELKIKLDECAKNNQYEKVLELIDELLLLEPKNIMVYNNKGVALSNLGRNMDALEYFGKAIELDPKSSNTYHKKGTTLIKLKQYHKALECLNIAIGLDPKDSNIYTNKGSALTELKQYDKAIKSYDKAIKLDPKNNTAYFNKGNVLKMLERYDEAIKSYDLAIQSDPTDSDAYNNKGTLLATLGNYDEAIKSYDQAIKSNPSNSSAYLNKITQLKRLDKIEEAKKELSTFIKNVNIISYQSYFLLINLYQEKHINKDYISNILQKIINKPTSSISVEGKNLYSYLPFNKETIDSIVHEYKYASPIFGFNDPTDPTIRLIKGTDDMKDILEHIKIACFSTNPLNMLMFSHYANKHKGICIEYDFSKFNKNNQTLLKMHYRDEINIDEQALQIITRSSNDDQKEITSFIDLFNTKHTSWKYEDEYRVITYDVDKIKLPIKAIYFGKEITDHDIKLIKKLCANKKPEIKFYRVEVDKINLFKLNKIEDIEPLSTDSENLNT